MTIMNGKIRAELTDLLADHLALSVGGCQNWHRIADAAMDFIYGGEDDHLPQPELQEVQADPTGCGQGDPDRASCCDGFTCRCCPGHVDLVEGGPVGPNVTYGVMTPQELLRDAFVYLGRPSPTEEFVRLPRSGCEPTPPSPQGSGSADD